MIKFRYRKGVIMTRELAELQFSNIEKLMHCEIICVYWSFGERIGIKGTLQNMTPFSHITVNNEIIDFVGEFKAIEYILYEDKKETKKIYYNPNAKGYKGFVGRERENPVNLIEEQKRQLGYSYREQELLSGHVHQSELNEIRR